MADGISTKIDMQYAEDKPVFLFCDCSLNKKYSFWNIQRVEAEKLIRKLKMFKQLTWNQFANLPRSKGLTPENSGSESFGMIDEQNTSLEKTMGQYHYFHFRIEEDGLFRVFGYQNMHYFCITHIDPKGIIHHS